MQNVPVKVLLSSQFLCLVFKFFFKWLIQFCFSTATPKTHCPPPPLLLNAAHGAGSSILRSRTAQHCCWFISSQQFLKFPPLEKHKVRFCYHFLNRSAQWPPEKALCEVPKWA